MEIQAPAVFLSLQGQLTLKCLLVHSHAHTAEFYASAQDGIPYEQVTIEPLESILVGCTPVIIVGSTQVMFLAIREVASYTHHEHSTIFAADKVLALLGCLVGIHAQEFLAMDEMNLLGQEMLQLRVGLTNKKLGTKDGAVNLTDDMLEEGHCAVLGTNDTLPVPLVHIQAVDIVQFLIGTDGIHVGHNAKSALHVIVGQGDTFPFRQTVYHLGNGLVHILDRETDGALHTIEIIVQS